MAPPKGSTRTPTGFKPISETGTNQSIADNYSYTSIPKPFKDESQRRSGTRRNKTLKQIITAERYRAKLSMDLNNKPATCNSISQEHHDLMDEDGNGIGNQVDESTMKKPRNLPVNVGAVLSNVNYSCYMTIEAPPSVIPAKKYCDVTGLEAAYVDPKSRLRYHNVEVYELIKSFGPGVDQVYLSLRGAHTTLK